MATARSTLRLGKQDDGRLVSSGEFAGAEFDEPWRYEREDGRLIVLAPPAEGHVDASEPWRDELVIYKRRNPAIVQKVVSEAWIRIDPGVDRVADIAVYLVPTGSVLRIPDRVPEIVFEIVSRDKVSRDRDYIAKRAEYHRIGVREYVIIDRFRAVVSVLAWNSRGYEDNLLDADDVYTSPLLPGLAISLAEVL